MKLEITPDAPPDEREALAAALSSLASDTPAARRSAWWRAGVEENVGAREGELTPRERPS
ncbi:MAG: hypothetical protein M3304_01155 [Actinomycetota bacterium]|nr:hypothetical protein [Actinomycetota bacterium]